MQSVLEQRFPHIVNRLMEAWPQGSGAARYLDELLFTGRLRSDRHGFDENVWMELTFLNELLRIEHPPARSDLATDVWATTFESGAERAAPPLS